ncbi:hypothetical protein M885DRAFT_584165 [Pelagophyceae sp. CCMP2097]|nr:hypothetical protein M885DRAFT_584165 [Pelagophyceae sp. CCMP2097]
MARAASSSPPRGGGAGLSVPRGTLARCLVACVAAAAALPAGPGPPTALAPALAVVVPTTTLDRDVLRLRNSFRRWNEPEFAPCRAVGVAPVEAQLARECGYSVDAAAQGKGGPSRPESARATSAELVIYSNHDFEPEVQDLLRSDLGRAAACFGGLRFLSANLTEAQDGYPHGASYMFYEYVAQARRGANYFLYLEPDATPIRARWLESIFNLVPGRAPRFWVKGSVPRGPTHIPEWAFHHVNGNALYNARDPAFRRFVEATARRPPRIHEVLDSYDLALAAGFFDPHCGAYAPDCHPVTDIAWRQDHAHLYVFAEFIVNHHGAKIDVAEARELYPCSVLLHGARAASAVVSGDVWISRTGGIGNEKPAEVGNETLHDKPATVSPKSYVRLRGRAEKRAGAKRESVAHLIVVAVVIVMLSVSGAILVVLFSTTTSSREKQIA